MAIKIKRSTTASAVPSSLVSGEIAINEADGKMYYRATSGTVTQFSTPTISHTHGNITYAGAIGSTSGLPIITTTSGVLTAGSFGTQVGTFCQGNDSRLSDARTPTAHKASHSTGGSDAMLPSDIGAAPTASPTFTGTVSAAAVTLSGQLLVTAGSVSACGVAFSGDPNTGLAQLGGADTASLVTAGVERVRCTSGGTIEVRANAGSISHGLTYNENGGEIILYDETQTAATLIDQISTDTRVLELVNGSNLKLGLGSGNTTGLIQFMRAGYQEAMRIDASGNVGIGNIVPAYRFEVRGAGAQARFYNSTTDAVVYIQGLTPASPWFGAGKSACQIDVDGWGGFAWQTDVTSGAKLFKLINNGGYGASESTVLTVNASGNVGIGVSPTHRLDCNGEFRLRGTGASTEAGKLHLYWVSSTNRATWTTDASGNALLETGGSAPTARLWVNANGNVGVGAAPSDKFHVEQSSGFATIILKAAASVVSRINFQTTTNANGYINYDTGAFRFFTDSAGAATERVQIASDGKLYAFNTYGTTVGATNRDLFIDSGGLIGYVSSIRASKTGIAAIDDVSWLRDLTPVSFHYRKRNADGTYSDEPDGTLDYGLIAEDVEPVAPEMCFYDVVDGEPQLRGVHYSKLITPMLRYIQQLEARIAALEERLNHA